MTDNPWLNQADVHPFGYADPEANKEIQRLRAKIARVEEFRDYVADQRWSDWLGADITAELDKCLADPEDHQ